MNPDLPFVAEYAKSGRASCKTCKTGIEKDCLRIGVLVQSPNFDGKIPMWHHFHCFLNKKKFSKVEDIANFDNLRFEDQKKIKDGVGKASNGTPAKGGKKVKNDFSIEYAKSSRAACKECLEKIQKGVIRISKLITDSPEAHRFGPMPGWRHVDCFVKVRLDLDFPDAADKLPGFQTLSDEDQKMVSDKIGQLGIKRKAEEVPDVPTKKLSKEDKRLKAQSDLLFDIRDKLRENLSKKEMIKLLEHNNQHISIGEQNLRDNLSDCLVFGAIKACPECKISRPRFKLDAYRCSGNVTEWTKCQYVTKCPEREPFVVPEDFKEEYEFLREYKYVKRDRFFPDKDESASSSTTTSGPLNGFIVSLVGKFKLTKSAMEKKVMELGGATSPKITSAVNFIISTEAEVAKDSKNILKACELDIHVVSPKFLEDVKNSNSTPAIAIKENCICSWGGDPILKFGIKQENKSKSRSQGVDSSSSYSSSAKSSKMKITVKGGAAVDPDSGKEDTCHVYQKKGNIYNSVLGSVDIARGMNTYYKLQVLESNKSHKYHLFRAWGRVGTTIGNNKIENFSSAADAVSEFERLYLEKTGNDWGNKFVKQPSRMYPLDIDYGEEADTLQELKPSDSSKLSNAIQELICLIFDIEAMKKAMVEFEIDLKKMPLGKLSKNQIKLAYSVLTEVQQILLTGSNAMKILDSSNRFYTLIPHDFGMKQPPLLDNEELIKSKIEMLDSLLEIEFAYKMLKGEGGESAGDPVYEHYKKLETDIEVLDHDSNEFDTINKYLKNTHAGTHNQYSLVLNEVFKINRHGESDRYQKFKDLHNKKLLWHGSRLTNFVGILSQGLRIAPPEAPPTGYMFGKGIYFADMVSKSANYCFTTKKNSTGLLLLCEVALGNMYEKLHSEYVEKLPKAKHSTKGVGMTVPDPGEKTSIGDVEVPYGKPVNNKVGASSLLYNEYIVYDADQVNIKYLLDVKFKWKH